MNQEIRNAERRRVLEMIEIEERLGPVVSGGPFRGSVAPAQHALQHPRKAARSASERARGRVRFIAHAVPATPKQAA